MEYVHKIKVKSGLEKNILKLSHYRVTIYIEKSKFWYLTFETKSGNCQISCLLIKSACLNFGTGFISNGQRWLS